MTARRLASLLALGLLASCAPAVVVSEPAVPEAAGGAAKAAAMCRVGPDGGPVLADRGIGGTGAAARDVQSADRGIGGTGVPAKGVQSADKGIGGTGIVGVITGFASLCVDGLEVAYDPAAPVVVDGIPAPGSTLRAGQLAVIAAGGSGDALVARRVAVRHEVSGPVEAVEGDGAMLVVAGQRVAASGPVWGDAAPHRGDWVAVSGVRAPSGEVVATRLDRRAPGRVTVRGPLTRDGDGLRIGGLRLQPAASLTAEAGSYVTASGRYADGVLFADEVVGDVLPVDPAAYFGRGVERFFVESYATVASGRVQLGGGLAAPAGPGVGAMGGARPAVVEFERGPGGSLVATGLRDLGGERAGTLGALPGSGPGGPGRSAPPALGPGSRGPAGFAPSSPMPTPTWAPAPVPNASPAFAPGPGRASPQGFGRGADRSLAPLRAGDRGALDGLAGRAGGGRGPPIGEPGR